MAEVPQFKKQYFLPPTKNNPPNGFIQLGRAIPKPDQPDDPINGPIAFGGSFFADPHSEYGWSYSASDKVDTSGGVWASFLEQIFGASGSAGVQKAKGSGVIWTASQVITCEFRPNKDYLTRLLEETNVKEYLVDNKCFLTPTKLYLIDGVKIALGASMVNQFAREFDIHMHGAMDLTAATGQPIGLGGQFQSQSSGGSTEIIQQLDPFILGYRLRQLKIGGKLKMKENARYDRGATFSNDNEDMDEIDPNDVEVLLEEEQDVELNDSNWEKLKVGGDTTIIMKKKARV